MRLARRGRWGVVVRVVVRVVVEAECCTPVVVRVVVVVVVVRVVVVVVGRGSRTSSCWRWMTAWSRCAP